MPGVETKSNKAHGALELDFSSTNQNAIEHTELLGSQSGEGEDGEGTPPPGNDFPPLIQHLPAPLEAGKQPSRTIGILGLAILSYVAVCGGPFGIEQAVGAAGPYLTLLFLVAAGVLWALPQAILTAELSTIYDENGGYIVWVQEALGPFWGFLSAFNALVANLCDLPAYPVLYTYYLKQYFHLSDAVDWSLKLVTLAIVVALNVRGMEAVTLVSLIFTVIVLSPFLIQPFMVAPDPSQWQDSTNEINWGLLVSTVLWNFQGWNTMGCVAGEVKNAKRSYPIGVIIAILMVIGTYAIPIMVGVVVEPDYETWGKSVNLVDVAFKIAKWLGVLALIGATLATVGEFSAAFSSSSRALQRMAGYRMLPNFLVHNRTKYATPVPSILFEAVATAILMLFDLSTLLIITTLFNNIAIALQIAAYLYLKHKHPNMERPYSAPGGIIGAYFVTCPQLLFISYATYTLGISWHLGAGVGLNIVFLLGAYWWAYRYIPQAARRYTADANLQAELDALGNKGDIALAYETPKAPIREEGLKRHSSFGDLSPKRSHKIDRNHSKQTSSLLRNDDRMEDSKRSHNEYSPLSENAVRYGSCPRRSYSASSV